LIYYPVSFELTRRQARRILRWLLWKEKSLLKLQAQGKEVSSELTSVRLLLVKLNLGDIVCEL
jgi:hypothetical protein